MNRRQAAAEANTYMCIVLIIVAVVAAFTAVTYGLVQVVSYFHARSPWEGIVVGVAIVVVLLWLLFFWLSLGDPPRGGHGHGRE